MIDVLIIGAGPAGLALACDLRRRNISVRIVDRLGERVTASKGKGLQPRTLEVFDDLGLIAEVLDKGCEYPPIAVYNGPNIVKEQRLTPIREATEAVPYPNVIMLPQWITEDVLTARLGELGGSIERNIDFQELSQAPDHVRVTVSGPGGTEIIEARYVVGADGGRSAVRKALDIALVGDTPILDGMLVGDVRADGISRDHWHMWMPSPREMVLLCPLPSTDAFQYVALVPGDAEIETTLEAMQGTIDARSGGAAPKLRDPSWISLYRPNIRMAARFRDGRAFLIGDAAHVHPPTGGQGLNTSVQDAYNLGWKLAAVLSGEDATLLDTYEEERQRVAASMLGLSESLYRRGLKGDESAMQRGDDEQQLLLNYRGSSLAAPAGTETDLQPGDRMPDASLETGSGEATSLFNLMRGPEAVTLSVTAEGSGLAIRIKRDGSNDDRRYSSGGTSLAGLAGHEVRIRPDGYIRSITKLG